jgi:hypothetical protein
MHIQKFLIPTGNGDAPVLLYEPSGITSRGTVLLYHGLGATKEVQSKELEWLSAAGLRGLCVDAPHHGERADGLLDRIAVAEDPHPEFIRIVQEAALEVPSLVDFCINKYGGKAGICGISLGGFISFAAVPIEKRLAASVPILGSPDWSFPDDGPIYHPEDFAPCALLAANAARDVIVAPQATRSFIHLLQHHYRDCPDRLRYLEYPESEHMMREQDWFDLWQKTTAWFNRFLA